MITVVPGNQTLTVSWSLPVGAYFAVVKWLPHASAGPWNVGPNLYNACTIAGLQNGSAYDIQVVYLPAGGVGIASGTPAAPIPPAPPTPVTPPVITAK